MIMCCKVGFAPVAAEDLFAAQVLFVDDTHLCPLVRLLRGVGFGLGGLCLRP